MSSPVSPLLAPATGALAGTPAAKVMAGSVTFLIALVLAGSLFVARAGAVDASGNAVATLGTGKAGKKLTRQGVRFKPISPATVKRLKKGKARITTDAESVKVSGSARVGLRGGITLKRGKRRFQLRDLVVKTGPSGTLLKGDLAGAQANVARIGGKTDIDPVAGVVAMTKGKLSLTGKVVRKVKRKLRLKKAPRGVIGKLDFGGQAAFEDPYLAECGLAANTRTAGTLPAPAPLPDLSGAVASAGNPVTWGVKASLRGYIGGVGKFVALDGATVNDLPPFPGPPPSGFTFPDDAEYAANGPGAGDDQAVLNGSGTILFCNATHGFRIALSNPTVVIDGASSRLIADVDTNTMDLSTGISDWIPAQRIDFATLDTGSIVPDAGTPGKVTWTDVPANLTAAGATSLRLCAGNPGPCSYVEGAEFDPITVTVKTTG